MESEVQAPGVQLESGPALGFGGKLVNIFASPMKTFESLDKKPSWVAPLVIFILIAVIFTQLSLPVIMEGQREKILSNPSYTDEQRAAMEQYFVVGTSTRVRTLITQAIATPIVYLIFAGIFYLVGSVFLGGDTSYKKVLAVVSWSWLILAISTIVTILIAMSKKNMDVSLSLALLLSADAIGTKLHTFLSKFDFFVIWFLAVFALGFGYIYKFSTSKAFAAVGALWAVWIAVSVALSGALKQFGF